ncbi:hypothetical protein LGZ99_13680 [Photorhabdus temperata]|uniref:Uncharacterized protein n=1 Tax=Photorhabdus temperata subsp. temperata Meg1 TaxID=1393735 RepID=A0A081S0K3_PHOTE|nr:hypothetical protein [Photorhabdus temperata]KER04456.1 hypothetical protein MEG1DRAFT_01002 [Photorhabdus temperata subsp. temperata Meg1]MCT8348218.1 hypothetical protein [Photorhabdus temperata]
MTNYSFLDEMKENFLGILNQKSAHSVDIDDLSVDYNVLLESKLVRHLELLQSKAALLAQAKIHNDELAIRAAILEIRIHAMSLSSFFDAIAEDTEVLLRTGKWSEIPEDYKIPDHYNYPSKK